MPRRNVTKQYAPESYYHVYNRGVFGQDVFTSEDDASAFLNQLKKHLSKEPAKDDVRRTIPHYRKDIELLTYCLMPSHFHLLIYNRNSLGLPRLMHSLMTAYSLYFNKKHKRRGVLFETSYKASMIHNDAYLWHISRYIHLNPQDIGKNYKTYPYSSLPFYLGGKRAEWINPKRILGLHEDEKSDYASFVDDYRSVRRDLKQIEKMLANS